MNTECIQSISEEEYVQILSKCEKHLQAIKTIVESFTDSPEGNMYYRDKSFTVDLEKAGMRKNIMTLAKVSKTILEIGFNMGHSALFMIVANPECVIDCFDICYHTYTKYCFNYLQSQFPNRLTLTVGNSNHTVKAYKKVVDMAHVDGGHDLDVAKNDLKSVINCTKTGGIIVLDDTWIWYLLNLWNEKVSEGIVSNVVVNECIQREKQTGHCIGRNLHKKLKIALLTLVLGSEEYRKIVKYGHLGKELYAKKHGYDFRCDEDTWDKSRPYAWSKVQLILKCLRENKYDYVVWIDADTHIMNDEKCLEDFISSLSNDRDILLAQDYEKINSGVMFIKNSDWSKSFFEQVYNKTEYLHHSNWEQEAIIHMYANNEMDCKEHITALTPDKQTEFNSYYFMYKHGQFLVHLAGCYRNDTNRNLDNAMIDHCPLRMDSDTDESFRNRMKFLGRL